MRKGWPRPRPGRPFGPWLLLAEALLLVSLVAGVVGALSLPEPVRREAAGRLTLPAGGLAPGQEVLAARAPAEPPGERAPRVASGALPGRLPLGLGHRALAGLPGGLRRRLPLGMGRERPAGGPPHPAAPQSGGAAPLALLAAALARLSARIFVSLWRGRPQPRGPLLADGLAALGATAASGGRQLRGSLSHPPAAHLDAGASGMTAGAVASGDEWGAEERDHPWTAWPGSVRWS